ANLEWWTIPDVSVAPNAPSARRYLVNQTNSVAIAAYLPPAGTVIIVGDNNPGGGGTLKISAALANDKVVLTWTDPAAVLQVAGKVEGPYTDAGGTSPVTVDATSGQKFWRLRK
ncbi:MAG TPA: hypothetical protein VHH73_03910, partial [Verrucomicrobiae bacterium]|nr:hypothetical protein [Verrucomicrobiae bacterium]